MNTKTLFLDVTDGRIGVADRDPTEEECARVNDGELEAFRFDNGRFFRANEDGEFYPVDEGDLK